MPKTDRHSIKVTVGCQCNKCLQSHKAVEEGLSGCRWALKRLFIKSLIRTVFMRRFFFFCSSALFTFLRPNKSCKSWVCCRVAKQTWLLANKPYLICHRKLWVTPRPCGCFTLSSYGQGSVAPAFEATSVTLKLLLNMSAMKFRPRFAGQYELTAMGLWEMTAVDTRKRGL